MIPAFLFLLFLSLVRAGPTDTSNGIQGRGRGVSKKIEEVNAGMANKLKHGDVMEGAAQDVFDNADPCTTSGRCLWPKSGSYVEVPVSISRKFKRSQRTFIRSSLKTVEDVTCIRFVKKTRSSKDFINIFPGSGCWSYVGRIGGRQRLSLQSNGCVYLDIVQHEILHALGFHHEQVRSDRDTYVSILFENIRSGTESNFAKVETNNLNTPYDFDSVMHYSNYAFSKNGLPTIVAKSDPNLKFGLATEMSANDIERVNRLYQCEV